MHSDLWTYREGLTGSNVVGFKRRGDRRRHRQDRRGHRGSRRLAHRRRHRRRGSSAQGCASGRRIDRIDPNDDKVYVSHEGRDQERARVREELGFAEDYRATLDEYYGQPRRAGRTPRDTLALERLRVDVHDGRQPGTPHRGLRGQERAAAGQRPRRSVFASSCARWRPRSRSSGAGPSSSASARPSRSSRAGAPARRLRAERGSRRGAGRAGSRAPGVARARSARKPATSWRARSATARVGLERLDDHASRARRARCGRRAG